MKHTLVRSADDVESAVNRYGSMLYRLTVLMLKNTSDAEDVVQETIIQYYRNAPNFTDSEHEKAWLIRVAVNKGRDMIRYRLRHPQLKEEFLAGISCDPSDGGILEALASLPEAYRLVLTLHYVEDYRVEEIAKIIGRSPSAVKMRLQKGRNLLKRIYREEYL